MRAWGRSEIETLVDASKPLGLDLAPLNEAWLLEYSSAAAASPQKPGLILPPNSFQRSNSAVSPSL